MPSLEDRHEIALPAEERDTASQLKRFDLSLQRPSFWSFAGDFHAELRKLGVYGCEGLDQTREALERDEPTGRADNPNALLCLALARLTAPPGMLTPGYTTSGHARATCSATAREVARTLSAPATMVRRWRDLPGPRVRAWRWTIREARVAVRRSHRALLAPKCWWKIV